MVGEAVQFLVSVGPASPEDEGRQLYRVRLSPFHLQVSVGRWSESREDGAREPVGRAWCDHGALIS